MTKKRHRVYTGRRLANGTVIVHVIGTDGDSKLLRRHPRLCNHSPDGFEWGYAGSGPAQLAFEILYSVSGSATTAFILHQQFKRERIANLPPEQPWRMTERDVVSWLENRYRTEEEKHG